MTTPPPEPDLEGFKSRLREALLEEHRRQRATTDQAPALAAGGPPAGIRRGSPSRRRLLLAAVMASVLVVALLVGLLPRGAGGPSPAAAAALDSVAKVAATQPGVAALPPDQFWYTKTQTIELEPSYRWDPRPLPPSAPSPWFRGVSRTTSEVWIGQDTRGGELQTRERRIKPRPTIYDQDRAAWTAAGEPTLEPGPARYDDTNTLIQGIMWQNVLLADDRRELSAKAPPQVIRGSQLPDYLAAMQAYGRMVWDRLVQRIQTLPTDPAALEKLLRKRIASSKESIPTPSGQGPMQAVGGIVCYCSTNEALFQIAGELLQQPMTSPALRAALYRMVAGLDGIDLFGPAADELGRHGTAVGMTFRGMRHELLFDPRSSRLLETRTVLAAQPPETWMNGLRYGTVLTSTLYLESRVVGSIRATR